MSREDNKKPSLPPFQVAGDEADILLADTYIIKALLVFVNACSYECGGKEKDTRRSLRMSFLQICLPERIAPLGPTNTNGTKQHSCFVVASINDGACLATTDAYDPTLL